MLLSPDCWQAILRLFGNHIFSAVTGLFRAGLDALSGIFDRDLGSMANVLGARLRRLCRLS